MKGQIIKLFRATILCSCLCVLIALGVALLLRTPVFSGMRAYLYRLIILEAICCILLLTAGIALCLKRKELFGLELSSIVLCIGISALFMALFFSMGPTTIDRSYTVFMLSDMTDHADIVYTAEEIKDGFVDNYIERFNESKRRIDEQLSIGNLEQVEGGYCITEKGQRLIQLFRFIEFFYPVADESSIYPNGR